MIYTLFCNSSTIHCVQMDCKVTKMIPNKKKKFKNQRILFKIAAQFLIINTVFANI